MEEEIMAKRNLIGSLVIVSTLVMMPLTVIADDDENGTWKFVATASTEQETMEPVPGLIRRTTVSATFDQSLSEVKVRLNVRGGDNVVAAHFHCALPGQNGAVAFGLFSPGPLFFDGARASGTLTNADWTGADCVGFIGRPVNTIAALAFAMRCFGIAP